MGLSNEMTEREEGRREGGGELEGTGWSRWGKDRGREQGKIYLD